MTRIAHSLAYSVAYGTTVAAAALAATFIASTAHAEGPIAMESSTPFVSTRSRAEVRAELGKAGEQRSATSEWALNQQTFQPTAGGPTRAQIAAEYISSRDEVHARTGEDGGSAYFASQSVRVPAGTMQAANTYR